MALITIDGLRELDEGEVFVKSGSHRATGRLSDLLGYPPQTFYTFERRVPAAVSYFVATKDEFEKIRGVRGVQKARFRRADRWQPSISFSKNPDGNGIRRGLVTAALAALGITGIVMGRRASRPVG